MRLNFHDRISSQASHYGFPMTHHGIPFWFSGIPAGYSMSTDKQTTMKIVFIIPTDYTTKIYLYKTKSLFFMFWEDITIFCYKGNHIGPFLFYE